MSVGAGSIRRAARTVSAAQENEKVKTASEAEAERADQTTGGVKSEKPENVKAESEEKGEAVVRRQQEGQGAKKADKPKEKPKPKVKPQEKKAAKVRKEAGKKVEKKPEKNRKSASGKRAEQKATGAQKAVRIGEPLPIHLL